MFPSASFDFLQSLTKANDNNSKGKQRVIITLTCNHIFDKVSMTGTVCVGIMPVFCSIFNMSHINGNSSVPLLGGIINGAIVSELSQGAVLGCQGLGDGSCQGGLAVVNMANCSNIAMGFVTFKNLFSEWESGLN